MQLIKMKFALFISQIYAKISCKSAFINIGFTHFFLSCLICSLLN